MSRRRWQRCRYCGEEGHVRWWCGEWDGRPSMFVSMCRACWLLCKRGDALALAARWRPVYGDRARRKAADYCEGFAEVTHKRCRYDGARLPVSAFDRFEPSVDGYRQYCRECAAMKRRERRAKERLKVLGEYRRASLR